MEKPLVCTGCTGEKNFTLCRIKECQRVADFAAGAASRDAEVAELKSEIAKLQSIKTCFMLSGDCGLGGP
jgi:hypothetical protein